MNSIPSRARVTGRFFIACALGATLVSLRADESAPAAAPLGGTVLESVVVSATRTPQTVNSTPGAVTLVSLDELALTQVPNLQTALSQQAGVAVVSSGAFGSQTSVFMRGAESHQTMFFVDGVRMNDRSALYVNYLGSADLAGLGRLEVLRGPQSPLYGSAAMGGVILIETAHGAGAPSGVVQAMAGSFDTLGASVGVRGGESGLGYSVEASRFQTDNDRPDNSFEQWSYATRLEYAVSDTLLFGTTYRGQVGEYEEPGSLLFPFQGVVDAENHLVTAYGEIRPVETVTSRLTAALHRREYDFTSAFGDSPMRNTREVLDWQNTYAATEEVELVAGATYEEATFTGAGERYEDSITAGYLSALVRPVETLTLTAGVRHDDYDSVGGATTWRTGAAWRISSTTLRATYGTAFTAPSAEDVFGVAAWGQLPNPDLEPEESRGWDAGIDQAFLDGRLNASVTYFRNKFNDKFQWQGIPPFFFTGQVVNVARATTQGVEVELTARPVETVGLRLAYTYLDAKNETTGARLIRRPRHAVDTDANVQVTSLWLIGAGLHIVADRVDAGGVGIEDYTTVRVYTSYAVRENLLLKLRVENALDESYEETLGYPALPVAVYGGVEWRF